MYVGNGGVNMWTPYEQVKNHPQDFDVKYKLYSEEKGGRKVTFQGLRCDFSYEGDDISKDGIYMIYPEFEDENGDVILDMNKPIQLVCTARMWIVIPEMRNDIHKSRIEVGTKGYMMEGSRKIGEVEVIRIVGLHTNS